MHHVRPYLLSCLATLAALTGNAEEQPVPARVWSGAGSTGHATDPINWQESVAPSGEGGERLFFGDITSQNTAIFLPPALALRDVIFQGVARPDYSFSASDPTGGTQLFLSGDLSAVGAGAVSFDESISIILGAPYIAEARGPNTLVPIHTVYIDDSVWVSGDISESGTHSIMKVGTGTLGLRGNNAYSGGTVINAGTIAVESSQALGDGKVTVNAGGSLILGETSFANEIELNSGARLGGYGMLSGPVTIANGAILAPGGVHNGRSEIGTLWLMDELTFGEGGVFEIQVANYENYFYSDSVIAESSDAVINITSTANAPFTIKLVSHDEYDEPGELPGSFLLGHSYEILFASAQTIEGSFVLGQNLLLDLSDFNTGNTEMSFRVYSDDGSYYIGFTPVPEPSTYALMALGLGFIGFTVWRRRRRST